MPARTTARKVEPAVPAKKVAPAAPTTNGKSGTRRVTFKLLAPEAHEVSVAGTFNDWTPGRTILKKDPTGAWKAQVTLTPGTYEYRYVVDGERRDDTDAPRPVPNPYGTVT